MLALFRKGTGLLIAYSISPRTLAETLNISPAYLSAIERSTRCAPSMATRFPAKLMEALGIDEDVTNVSANSSPVNTLR